MNAILFLDVDGVLVTTKSLNCKSMVGGISGQILLANNSMDVMDQSCLTALRKILDATGAKIVFSTARRISMSGLRDAFALNNALDIWWQHIGKTPDQGYNSHRPNEITAWLDNIPNKYVVIDDLDMKWYFKDAFFGTYIDDGLTDAIADDIIKYLNS